MYEMDRVIKRKQKQSLVDNKVRLGKQCRPDQTPQNAASDQAYTVGHTYSNILDTPRGSRIDYFKFKDTYGK